MAKTPEEIAAEEKQRKLKEEEASQAPPVNSPLYIDNAVHAVREDQEKAKVSIAENEVKVLMEGSQSDFWQVLKKRMLNTTEVMRRAEATRMGTGNLDLAAIGVRSVIINEIADAFQDIINTVEQKYRRQIVDNLNDQEDLPTTIGLESEDEAPKAEASE